MYFLGYKPLKISAEHNRYNVNQFRMDVNLKAEVMTLS